MSAGSTELTTGTVEGAWTVPAEDVERRYRVVREALYMFPDPFVLLGKSGVAFFHFFDLVLLEEQTGDALGPT